MPNPKSKRNIRKRESFTDLKFHPRITYIPIPALITIIAWAKEHPMLLGTPAKALSWFSRLLSGSAHNYIVSSNSISSKSGRPPPFYRDWRGPQPSVFILPSLLFFCGEAASPSPGRSVHGIPQKAKDKRNQLTPPTPRLDTTMMESNYILRDTT